MSAIAGTMGRLMGALVFLAVTASCITPTEPRAAAPVAVSRIPDWVTNPARRYPAAHYLAAVGSGDSRRAAEDNAVAGLARIFESKIDAEETLVEQYRELMGSSGNRFEARSEMDQRVRIRSRQELLNVQFGECAIDPMGRAYIIAFMERRPTSAVYTKRIQENEDAVRRFVARADSVGDAAQRYAYRQAAWIVARANQGYLQQLDILQPGASTNRNPGYTVDGLLTAAQEAARALRVAIVVEGDQDGALLAAVTATITGLGFSVVQENAVWQLKASLRVEPVKLARADAEFVRYEYAARIIQGDAIILADTGAGREGHVNLQGARQRAVARSCTDIQTKLKTGLQRHFTQLTQD